LAIAKLGVFEAVVFVRQRQHGLGEEGQGAQVVITSDVDRELAGTGAEEMAADAYVVAEVEKLVEGEGIFADVVLADVNLEALSTLLKLRKAGFALDANGHDASGDADVYRIGVELLGREGIVCGADLGNGVAASVVVWVGRFGVAKAFELTKCGDLLKFVAALLVKILFKLRLVHRDSFGMMLLTYQYSDVMRIQKCLV